MYILPAIDLKDGKVVRLYKGDFNKVHQVAQDPLETARAFSEAGARWIHMVDLDGARGGTRINGGIVAEVTARSGLQVELGGGIRCMEDLEAVFQAGVGRAVIGSAAVSDPDFVRAAAERYGERVAVGIDTQDGRVRTAGWVEDSGLDYLEFAKFMMEVGVKNIIFTDIETDGALSGPSCPAGGPETGVHREYCIPAAYRPMRISAVWPAWGCTGPSWERRTTRGRWIWPRQCGTPAVRIEVIVCWQSASSPVWTSGTGVWSRESTL